MIKQPCQCPKCASKYEYEVKRNWVLRYLLFFLPIKIFFCLNCMQSNYLLFPKTVREKQEQVV